MLWINGRAKSKMITIDPGLTVNSVSEHHRFKLLLKLND